MMTVSTPGLHITQLRATCAGVTPQHPAGEEGEDGNDGAGVAAGRTGQVGVERCHVAQHHGVARVAGSLELRIQPCQLNTTFDVHLAGFRPAKKGALAQEGKSVLRRLSEQVKH